ncbi:hypothetical protein JZM28_17730 [Enterobacter hormaechei]|uniref:hypothetical protein n=1 Tax=Enterobacter cloacae complex TaxID=354276 RepID=UPI0019803D9C|nr:MULTISPECIES: hypothetical protein [Enterobacter cloacae complex]MCU2955336.1 hypothetical protein [Enterobacter hormaechei subsp. hoffmannii]MCU3660903.1 hypothetical protein [Enterobacter hormaechei subsp. steigerwaltii]MBK4304111.1 hypothetical protein [Enterobacter hormaechei]MBN6402184.1 hypothetical protein [Enterobacter hormaechei]MCU3793296.1 hypothetical protein [Enterobacter hormaechei subsp. steigerwaltii]
MGIIARSIHGRSISPDAYGVNIETIKDCTFLIIDHTAENLRKKFHIRNAPIAYGIWFMNRWLQVGFYDGCFLPATVIQDPGVKITDIG